MRLVLDAHYSPAIAAGLREQGFDVVAAAQLAELRTLPDEELLYWARRERRVLVTENVRDFMVLHHTALSRGEPHSGLLFTSPRKFPRRKAAIGQLLAALAAYMEAQPDDLYVAGGIDWL